MSEDVIAVEVELRKLKMGSRELVSPRLPLGYRHHADSTLQPETISNYQCHLANVDPTGS